MKAKFSEDPKEWRKNAWLSALGMAFFSSVLRWRHILPPMPWEIILAILAAIAVVATIQPRWFRAFHRFSARLGFTISQFAGRIVLSIFFILIITPLSIIRRAMGKDPLRIRRPDVQTYWTPAPAKTPLNRLF